MTIKQFAKEAGVSTQTVSRVVNDCPDVAPETSQRVLEMIHALFQTEDHLARAQINRQGEFFGLAENG